MHRRRRRNNFAILGGAAGTVVALGIILYLLTTHDAPGIGGTYTEGIPGNPITANPVLAAHNDPDKDLSVLLFAGLTRLDTDGSLLPDLAESWQISDDAKTYTIKLRPGLKWHDGMPLTTEDALFTYRLLQIDGTQADPDLTALWKKVKIEKVDDQVIRFVLDTAFAPFLTYTSIGLLPRHLLNDVDPKNLATAEFNSNPVGAGPFRLKEARIDQFTLEANKDYHRGRPFLDNIVLRFLKDDQTLAAALSAKQIDGGLLRPSLGAEAMTKVEENRDLAVQTLPRASYSVLFLNTGSGTFTDKNLRKAVALSINKRQLIEDILGGMGVPATGPVAPNSWAYQPSPPGPTYNPEMATKIMTDSGWRKNRAGNWEKDGRELSFHLFTNNDKTREATSKALEAQLKQAGFKVESASSGITGLLQNFLIPRKYDAILYGVDPGADPDPYPFWHSSQNTQDGLNVSGLKQPKVDDLLEKGRTVAVPEARRELYKQFQDTFAEEMPSIPLYHPAYLYAMDKEVKGVSVGVLFSPSSRFQSVAQWYKNTRRTW